MERWEYCPHYGEMIKDENGCWVSLADAQAEIARLRGALGDVRRERELEKLMGYCVLRRIAGYNGIAVDDDEPAKEWQKLDAERKALLTIRQELLAK